MMQSLICAKNLSLKSTRTFLHKLNALKKSTSSDLTCNWQFNTMSKIYLLAVGSSKKIFLEKNEVILGRGIVIKCVECLLVGLLQDLNLPLLGDVTGIQDKRCSREQARINIQKGQFNTAISITSLGINPLAIKKKNSDNFSLLEKQKMVRIRFATSFELLL